MKFIDIAYDGTAEDVIKLISDNDTVNADVNFDDSKGVPHMKIKRKDKGRIKVTCEFVGGPTKDNGFLVGTYFSGKLTEVDGKTRLKGIITTAPIYHLFIIAFVGVFVYQCIKVGGFHILPPVIVAFDILLFWKEFKKQGYIQRYLRRAARKMNE